MNMAEMQSGRCLSFVLYSGRRDPHLCKEYDESIRRENIGAIPLLPGHLDQLERRMTEIVGKRDAHAHLDAVIPTRGTTAVVGKGFSEESMPTIELQPNEWPRLSETGEKYISVPVSQVSRISSTLPTLIRLKSSNKPEVILKILFLHAKRSTHWDYSIEWTPEGYTR